MDSPEGNKPTPPGAFSASTPRDPWRELSRFTRARIAPGRTGGSLPTGALLDFRLAHARARDAVAAPFDADRLEHELADAGIATVRVATAAYDRREYLLRPDLGRRLAPASCAELQARANDWGRRDLVVIVSDGLSAQAAGRHAVAVVAPLVAALASAGWSLYPVIVAPLARVKLQDEIGELLGARQALMLLGERPGLGAPDSLGAYFTFSPRAACTDADRNCVSNIRPEGLPPAWAARKLVQLLGESARLGVSGVALKDSHALPSELDA